MNALEAMRKVFGKEEVDENRTFVKDGVDWISLNITTEGRSHMAVKAQDTVPAQMYFVKED